MICKSSLITLKRRKDGQPIHIHNNIPEREVNIENTVNVPERTAQIDASTMIAPGAVVVNHESPKDDVEIVRDASGQVIGARRG